MIAVTMMAIDMISVFIMHIFYLISEYVKEFSEAFHHPCDVVLNYLLMDSFRQKHVEHRQPSMNIHIVSDLKHLQFFKR